MECSTNNNNIIPSLSELSFLESRKLKVKDINKFIKNNNIKNYSKYTNKDDKLNYIKEYMKNNNYENNKLKTIETRKKRALARHTDSHYYITKYLTSIIVNNPIFEDRDLKKKLEIFGIPNIYTCFVSKTKQKSKGGDHLFEINGYSNITDCRGVDDEWNIIPVSSKYNVSYKIIEFSMNDKIVKKNIGYESLTDEEFSYLKESDKDIYKKIYHWKKYVSERGATICFKNPNCYNKVLEDFSEDYKLAMEKAIRKCEDYKL